MNYKVNIVMATYNRLESTKKSLPSLIETASDNIKYMISVVDNGSSDGTPDYLNQLFNEGKINNLLLLDENIGVSRAHNIMWKLYDDIDFYNKVDNDMFFKKKNWINEAIHIYDNSPELGAVGYLCNYQNQHPVVNNDKVSYRRSIGNIGGACFFVSKNIHKKIGFWCEKYALYGEEDADFCMRLYRSNLSTAYLMDMDVMENIPEHWEDYIKFKRESNKHNLSGIFQKNTSEYYNGINIYQDSNELEKYKNRIKTNI